MIRNFYVRGKLERNERREMEVVKLEPEPELKLESDLKPEMCMVQVEGNSAKLEENSRKTKRSWSRS